MKNEIFLRAMGDVDDDLIADAHTVTKKVRLPMRHFAALAACLVLFFGALIYVGLPGTDIIIDGNVLSDVPVAVQDAAPVVHTADPQMRDGSVLTVPLQVRLRDASRITAVAGTFELLRNDTLLYTGTDTVAAGQLTLYWSIRIPDPTETYKLTVGGTTLSLYLDPATACWCMQKN